MNFFTKFCKVVLAIFVVYFLVFLIVGSMTLVSFAVNPPSSEFSGLGLYIFFFPFFAFMGFMGAGGIFYFILPLGLILTYITLRYVFKLKKTKTLIFIGIFISLIAVLNLFAYFGAVTSPNKPDDHVKILEEATKAASLKEKEVGLQAARDGNIGFCDYELAVVDIPHREACYSIAAAFSGNQKFCELATYKDSCIKNLETANNLANRACKKGELRVDCLVETCFPDGELDDVIYYIPDCIVELERISHDKSWCSLIVEDGPTHFVTDSCNSEPRFELDVSGAVVENKKLD